MGGCAGKIDPSLHCGLLFGPNVMNTPRKTAKNVEKNQLRPVRRMARTVTDLEMRGVRNTSNKSETQKLGNERTWAVESGLFLNKELSAGRLTQPAPPHRPLSTAIPAVCFQPATFLPLDSACAVLLPVSLLALSLTHYCGESGIPYRLVFVSRFMILFVTGADRRDWVKQFVFSEARL